MKKRTLGLALLLACSFCLPAQAADQETEAETDTTLHLTFDTLEQTVREGKRAVTLGPIIHNHHVVQHFAALGVREIASPEEVPGGSAVIIRSHGISRAVYEALGRPTQQSAMRTGSRSRQI